jgi:hypothetical protein
VACDIPPREELALHIAPHTRNPKPSPDGTSIRVLCPAHDDTEHSLKISVGDRQRIVGHCFAGCTWLRVRGALIVDGVQPGCLPLGRAERDDIVEQLTRILGDGTRDHAIVRLRALAALEGYRDLPRGAELATLAARAGVSLRTAFNARPGFNRSPST